MIIKIIQQFNWEIYEEHNLNSIKKLYFFRMLPKFLRNRRTKAQTHLGAEEKEREESECGRVSKDDAQFSISQKKSSIKITSKL